MGLSVTELYNLALNLAGTRSDVSAPDEESREAELCNLWYPRVRRAVFSAASWAVCKKTASLALLKERDLSVAWTSAEPSPPWIYAYQQPADYLHARFLSDYSMFEVSRFGNYNAILSSTAQAILTYTRDEEDTSLWSEALAAAVYHGLAARVVGPLSGSRRKAESLLAEANRIIVTAREQNANQDNFMHETMPDWLTARGIGLISQYNRFVYPVGPLLVAQVG